MSTSWFILCRVVDHYGDAGVCWRLARQLAHEYDLNVTLFIDDIATLQRLVPTLDATQDRQYFDHVTVQRLTDTLPPPASCASFWPDVIIDAFGGGLPSSWLEALERDFPTFTANAATPAPSPLVGEGAGERGRFSSCERRCVLSPPPFAQTTTPLSPRGRGVGGEGEISSEKAREKNAKPPHWIVLEYLSAEPWVETMHGLASPPPSINIPRHFFFPGFTEATGGLLREKTLLDERDAFQHAFSDARRAFLERLGVRTLPPDTLLISLFCYDTPALPALLNALAASPSPIVCLIPEIVSPSPPTPLPQGERGAMHGALTLHTIPFLPQADYDRLLWCCDLNFVRGEDSFVRAQWAAHPFIWQAYRQDEQAHLTKVEAFLKHYLANAPAPLKIALSDFTRAWNDEQQTDRITDAWLPLAEQLPAFRKLAHDWAQQQSAQTDLAQRLVCFCATL